MPLLSTLAAELDTMSAAGTLKKEQIGRAHV